MSTVSSGSFCSRRWLNMGFYISWDELAARYSKIAEDYDSESAATFIEGAEGELDARIAIRYTVPVTPTPGIIRDLAIDMSYYRMTWQQDTEDQLKDFIERRLAAITAGSM